MGGNSWLSKCPRIQPWVLLLSTCEHVNRCIKAPSFSHMMYHFMTYHRTPYVGYDICTDLDPQLTHFHYQKPQHLRRFLHPRSTYPDGKAGYLRWRRDLYTIQANYSTSLLSPLSLPEPELTEIASAIAKKDLLIKSRVHPTTTLLEDAAVLVFLRNEVEGFKKQHEEYDEEKWVGIVKKTWRKLSDRGKEEAGKLLPGLDEGLRAVVIRVVTEEAEKEAGND
ncbi:hypothetical protein TWF730_001405 [Orbilia blumenaviensis]|uniref:Uncharacterized protein n=1 Tax=Orbilia blumenaviensis TaxID=1796055 RepID=A0AAV9ULB0_9PEZI